MRHTSSNALNANRQMSRIAQASNSLMSLRNDKVFKKFNSNEGNTFFRKLMINHEEKEQPADQLIVKNDNRSKILRIINKGNAELMRERLELFGNVVFLENHFSEKEDIIVKFKKLEESIRAFETLKNEMEINFVPTKIDSDRMNQYKSLISDSQDDAQEASMTLNILKIKNDEEYMALGRKGNSHAS